MGICCLELVIAGEGSDGYLLFAGRGWLFDGAKSDMGRLPLVAGLENADNRLMSKPLSTLKRAYATIVFYPTLAWNMLLGRVIKVRQWWNRIDENLIVGAFPFARDVQAMHADGVRAVVNTCEEYEGPQSEYRELGIEQFHMPTTDFTHPKLDDIQKAVEFIQSHAEKGDTVYVHCKAGRARSATVALCWLVKYRGLSREQAQALLLEKRKHVNPRVCNRPVVVEFADLLEASDESVG